MKKWRHPSQYDTAHSPKPSSACYLDGAVREAAMSSMGVKFKLQVALQLLIVQEVGWLQASMVNAGL